MDHQDHQQDEAARAATDQQSTPAMSQAEATFAALAGLKQGANADNRTDAQDAPPAADDAKGPTVDDQGKDQQDNGTDEAHLHTKIEREAALAALHRSGFDDGLIGRLSDSELVEYGRRQRELQSEHDRIRSELGQARKAIEELQGDEEDGFEDPDLAKLAEVDPEAARRLSDKQHQADEAMREAEVQSAMDAAYGVLDGLARDFPPLNEANTRAKVISAASALVQEGVFDGMDVGPDLLNYALEQATRLVVGDPNKADTEARKSAQRQLDGQPDMANDKQGDPMEVPDDIDDWVMEQMMDPSRTMTTEQLRDKRQQFARMARQAK